MTEHRLTRRACLRLAGVSGALLLPGLGRASDGLHVLLPPFLSPVSLLNMFRPLREHLEQTLGQRVELYTRPDFQALVPALRSGEFEVALLAAHLAGLAIRDWGYQPLNGTLDDIEVLVVTRTDGPARTAADLRGRRVGMLDRYSMVSGVARRWLRTQGLRDPGGAEIVEFRSVGSAIVALDIRDVDAVAVAHSQLLALEGQASARLHVIARLPDIPAPVFVASPRLAPDMVRTIQAALHARVPDPNAPPTVANTRYRPIDDALRARLVDQADAALEVIR